MADKNCSARFARLGSKLGRSMLIGAAGLLLTAPAMARAESAWFDIAAQPLPAALKEFAAQAHMQLLYEHRAVASGSGNAVSGELDKRAALEQLLRNTGLEIIYSSEGAATIRPFGNDEQEQKTTADARESNKFRPAQGGRALLQGNPSLDSGRSVEEILVTARRREENIQTVPVAITVLSQQKLEDNNVVNITDLQHLVPSMSQNTVLSRDDVNVSLRGQTASNSRPGVIMYLNEVPVPPADSTGNLAGGPGLFFDLENVQVLKGPQGTLFGRESVGGAVLLQSARPKSEFGGRIQLGYGNYESREIDAAVNVPIVKDQLLTRVAFNGQKRDGFTRLQSSTNHPNGIDLDNRDYWSVRGSVAFRPSDWFENDTITTYQHYQSNGTTPFLSDVNPTAADSFGRLFPSVGFSRLSELLAQQQASGIRTHIPIDGSTETGGSLLAISNTTSIELADDLKWRTILGFDRAVTRRLFDNDGTPLPISNQPRTLRTVPRRQFTAESQLLGKSFSGRLDWIAGAFALESPFEDYYLQTGTQFGVVNDMKFRSHDESKALFAQGTYDLSAVVTGLKVTGGLRYTWDDRDTNTIYGGVGTNCTSVPKVRCDDSVAVRTHSDSSALTWTTGLDYQIAPETLIYLASRRGYRAGGINDVGGAAAPTYDPEYVLDYELGVKSDWMVANRALRTNAAIFYQDYTDIQVRRLVFLGNAFQNVTDNAAEARLWGGEIEALLRLTDGLELGANVSYVELKYTEFAEGVSAATISDLKIRQKSSPDWKYGLSARYALPFDPHRIGELSVQADWNWQAAFTLGTASLGTQNIAAHGLLNLAVKWEHIGGGPMDASFFMSNATNKEYALGGVSASRVIGYSDTIYGEPRMYGIRMRYRFGAE